MLLLTNTQKQLKSIGLLENQTSNSFIGWRLTWGKLAGQEINLDHLLIRIVVLNLSWRILSSTCKTEQAGIKFFWETLPLVT